MRDDLNELQVDGWRAQAPVAAFWGGGGQFEGRLGPWSTVRLGGKIFPGVDAWDDEGACPVRVKGGGIEYKVDSQRVKGKGGHKLNIEGYQPTKFTLEVKIYSPAQWDAYKAYFPTINPKLKENNRRAYSIEHPVLTLYGITSIYISGASFPDGEMIRDVQLSCWEVFEIKGSGKASTAKATDGTATIKVAKPHQNIADQAAVEPRNPKP